MTIEFQTDSRIYVDTNIWIYFVEGHPSFSPEVRALFLAAARSSARLTTNEITLAECLLKPVRDKDERKISAYETLFDQGTIEILPLDGGLARRAALAGGMLGLKLIDAIHHVSACEAGCRYFLTGDGRFRSGPDLTVIGID
ncbi:MAG: type II toxin-antitoxin system VapC family toxin [Rhizobiaceae bacterium]|nr:type II toxin-antitoxin system VapC family toxin [Rhizobiaceae bacterium]